MWAALLEIMQEISPNVPAQEVPMEQVIMSVDSLDIICGALSRTPTAREMSVEIIMMSAGLLEEVQVA